MSKNSYFDPQEEAEMDAMERVARHQQILANLQASQQNMAARNYSRGFGYNDQRNIYDQMYGISSFAIGVGSVAKSSSTGAGSFVERPSLWSRILKVFGFIKVVKKEDGSIVFRIDGKEQKVNP